MFRRIEYRYKTFQPAAVGSDETKALFSIKKGERVLWASYRPEIAAASSTDTTMILGHGDDTNGLIEAIDLEAMTPGAIVQGALTATLLLTSGGVLFAADDTIDVVYAGSTYGATNPKVTFCIAVIREW